MGESTACGRQLQRDTIGVEDDGVDARGPAGSDPGTLRCGGAHHFVDVGHVEPERLHADLAGVRIRLPRGLGFDPLDEFDGRRAASASAVVEEPRLTGRRAAESHGAGVLPFGPAPHLHAEPESLVHARGTGEGPDIQVAVQSPCRSEPVRITHGTPSAGRGPPYRKTYRKANE